VLEEKMGWMLGAEAQIERQLEIISEAAKHLSPKVCRHRRWAGRWMRDCFPIWLSLDYQQRVRGGVLLAPPL